MFVGLIVVGELAAVATQKHQKMLADLNTQIETINSKLTDITDVKKSVEAEIERLKVKSSGASVSASPAPGGEAAPAPARRLLQLIQTASK